VGLQPDVVFSDYTPLSSNLEMARRLLTPLNAARLPVLVAQSGKALREQPVDLAQEKYALYVPPTPPPNGYGLLVFVPPWDEGKMPVGWGPVLDRLGVIYVSAARSGNDQSVLGRREPLAILAAANVMARYKVDPARVYIGGMSGGSRVAMRIALGYPDVFKGAFLNAGSEPVGTETAPIPPKDLLAELQSSMHLVYVTGGDDTVNLGYDAASQQSMRSWCVFDIDVQTTLGAAHQTANPAALAKALEALEKPRPPSPKSLDACRARLDRDVAAELDRVDALIKAGKRDEARAMLAKIDARFGGLAAPRSLELQAK
jgi:pimeloyl-ACP methyl ester carboxylesterase